MRTSRTPATRRYDIDALRVIAFLILIFYHTAMVYVADWGFHLKSTYQYQWIKFPMILVNQWRMPLLFMVSGLASSFMLRKFTVTGFLKIRSLRLFLPFMTGLIIIIPPQPYFEALANASIEMSYPEFLRHYFTFQEWPKGAFDGSQYGFTWNHLWFIPYLLLYTVLLVPFHTLIRYWDMDKTLDKTGPVSLLIIPILLQTGWKIVLNDEKPISHAFFNDGYAHAMYFTFFLLGYLISDKGKVWSTIIRLRWFTLSGGIISYCCLISLWWVFNQHEWQDHLAGITMTINQWLWLLTVLAWSAIFLNRPFYWVRYANTAVYPWYIFHQTITITAAFYLTKLSLGGFAESSLVIIITILGCFLVTHYVIGRVNILKAVFGMK